jgi:hypothetical protein
MTSNIRKTHPIYAHITEAIVSNVEFSSATDKEKVFNVVQSAVDKIVYSLASKIRIEHASNGGTIGSNEISDKSTTPAVTVSASFDKSIRSINKSINKSIRPNNSVKSGPASHKNAARTSHGIENSLKILKDLDKEKRVIFRPTFKHSRRTSDGMHKTLKYLNDLNAEQSLTKMSVKTDNVNTIKTLTDHTGGSIIAPVDAPVAILQEAWLTAKNELPGLKPMRLRIPLPARLSWLTDPTQCM